MTNEELKQALIDCADVLVIVDDGVAVIGRVAAIRYSMAYGKLVVSGEIQKGQTTYIQSANKIERIKDVKRYGRK